LPDSSLSQPSTPTPDTCGGSTDTQTVSDLEPLRFVSHIKDLPLRLFVACFGGDYSGLVLPPTEIPEHEKHNAYAAWVRILSQYYTAVGDEKAKRVFQLQGGMERIRFRSQYVRFLCEAITVTYNVDIADMLRKEYPRWGFTVETYEQDIIAALKFERRNENIYEEYDTELKQLQGTQDGEAISELYFINVLISISSAQMGTYKFNDITVLEFALLYAALKQRIAQLNK